MTRTKEEKKQHLSMLWNLPLINCYKGFICGLAYKTSEKKGNRTEETIHCAGSPSKCTKTSANTSNKSYPRGRARKHRAVRREKPLWMVCHSQVYVGEKVNA